MFPVRLAEFDTKEHQTLSVSPGYSQSAFQERSGEQGCITWLGTCVVGSSDPIGLESDSFLYFFWLESVSDAQRQCCLGGHRSTSYHCCLKAPRAPVHGPSPLRVQRKNPKLQGSGEVMGESFFDYFLFQWLV